jgi:glycosyltransferase involved in cell wall biosynthesis
MFFPIQWSEPFGLMMLEAIVCGMPVLALAGALPEVIEDGVSGHICSALPQPSAEGRTL